MLAASHMLEYGNTYVYIYIFIYVAIYLFISLSFTLSMAEKGTFSRLILYSFRQRWFQVNSCNKVNVNV